VLDWYHSGVTTRTPTYGPAGEAQTAEVGQPGSPVSGTQFRGNCSVGGTWYTGTSFPSRYWKTYFHADWGQGWIKNIVFDVNDKPVAVNDFVSNGGAIVSVVQHPFDGSLYYLSYDFTAAVVRQIAYAGNRTPIAVATADKYYGPSPLTVQFSSSGSSDPDGQPITYSWNFGDGSPVSTQANPSHAFSAPGGVPTKFTVTLTVRDSGGLSAQASVIVSVNNTPPNVTITSPVDGGLYSPNNATTVNLTATVSDAESSDSQLLYQWQTLLHHNDHNHASPADTNHVTTTVISPTGCDGFNIYYYRIILTVTDPHGLSTTREVRLYPDCGPETAPVISDIPNQAIYQDQSTGPIAFTVGDAETAPDNLQLSATSSNPTLVPTNSIVFGGSASNRTVTVTPAAGQTGSATITVTVNDGPLNASDSFVLTVSSPSSGTASFTNASAITIPSVGAATPYPSAINVTGTGGTISQVTVKLNGLSHTYPDDLDLLLVGPTGQKVLIMSDVGGGIGVNNVNLTLSDSAAAGLPDNGPLVSGTFKPTDFDSTSDTFPAPAPSGPYGATLSVLNGLSANGTWSLYVNDDGSGDQGAISGGWSLAVTTSGVGPATIIALEKPARIESVKFDRQGGIVLTFTGEVGRRYAVEASGDLVYWTQVGVRENTSGSVVFSDLPTGNSIRFYRVVSMSRLPVNNQ